MSYYLLSSRFRLCGWDRLPFALFDMADGLPDFYQKDQFRLLMRCDGMQDIDVNTLPVELRGLFEGWLKDGIIRECGHGSMLDPRQFYHRYPCRYKKTVHWSITGRCNYRCRHCLVSAPHARFGHPDTGQLLDLVSQMAECGIAHVSLTGGEPLIRSDFWQIIDALTRHHIEVDMIFTNGYLVNDALLDGFEKRGLHPMFQMSYDGVGRHDWLRGFTGAEEAVNRAFALLKQRGYHADASMCLHKGNVHTLRESVLHLAELGVGNLKVNRIQELGEWADASEEVALTADESLEAYLNYIPAYFEDDCPLDLMLDGAFSYQRDTPFQVGMEYERPCGQDAGSESCLSCSILKSLLYIGPDGSVCPCMSMAVSKINDWPNVFETPLRETLGDTVFMDRCAVTIKQIRDENGRCRSCVWADRCNGGCRAAAVCAEPSITAPDPANCHFYFGGWYERFQKVSRQALDHYIARHPELADSENSDEESQQIPNCV